MIELLRASSTKRLLLFVIFLVITTLAVLLDIPVLRQLGGLLFLTILPGLLLLFLLKLNKLALAEKIVLTVGLSIAFLMFFGVMLNQACLYFGYVTPLSTNTLMLSLNLALVGLLVAAYIRNKEAFLSFPFHFELNTKGKLLLLLPSIFPLLSIAGTRLLNVSDNNAVLLAFLFLVPISVTLIVFQSHKVSKDIYPIVIVMIGAALLSMFWLRSEYILGHDVHVEYYLFHTTLLNSHWTATEASFLSSSLGITLIPAIYQSVLNLNGVEYLFKGVFTLICTLTPLIVYVISEQYIGKRMALLAALFFVSQGVFLQAPGSPRTNLSIFFFALSIMVLFHKGIGVNQRALFIIFTAATIVSHYSTTYIFFFLLLSTYLLVLIFRKYTLSKTITLGSLMLFSTMIFIWYLQVIPSTFKSGAQFIAQTMETLYLFAVEEARSPDISTLVGKGLAEKIIISQINFVIHWATFAFIGAGIIGTLIKRREMISAPQYRDSSPAFLQSKFQTEFFLFTLVCSGMLVAVIALPFVSIGYGIQRVYCQMAVISSCFFVLGGILLSKYIRASPRLLVLLILVPYFLFTTGTIYEVFGVHASYCLSSKTQNYSHEFGQAHDSQAAQWLKGHIEGKSRIYVPASYFGGKLVSQGKISPRLVKQIVFREHEEINGYLYLSYNNVVNEAFVGGGESHDINDYSNMIVGKNKLYDNGGSEVYK